MSVEVKRTGVIDAPSITDYRSVKYNYHKLYCDIICKKEPPSSKIISNRGFSNFDPSQLVVLMSEINRDEVTQIENVDEIERFIITNIKNVYDKHAPVVCKKVTKKKPPWRNQEIPEKTAINQTTQTFKLSQPGTDQALNNGLKLNADLLLHTAPHNLAEVLGRLEGLGVKTLGVLLDGNLTFIDHVSHTSQRALGKLRGLHNHCFYQHSSNVTLPIGIAYQEVTWIQFGDSEITELCNHVHLQPPEL
ncbi:hypothetical protein J6590_026816 [Homalodisca vitripennis]|nr:hypothetical protein J6590_026816 [Homalodisca vitripennis]